MPYFKVPALRLSWDKSKETYPDIWCFPDMTPPRIVVTREWAKQDTAERRKRLVHEMIHISYKYKDDRQVQGMKYRSHPEQDEYSRYLYNYIEKLRTDPTYAVLHEHFFPKKSKSRLAMFNPEERFKLTDKETWGKKTRDYRYLIEAGALYKKYGYNDFSVQDVVNATGTNYSNAMARLYDLRDMNILIEIGLNPEEKTPVPVPVKPLKKEEQKEIPSKTEDLPPDWYRRPVPLRWRTNPITGEEQDWDWKDKKAYSRGFKPGQYAIYSDYGISGIGLRSLFIVMVISPDAFPEKFPSQGGDYVLAQIVDNTLVEWDSPYGSRRDVEAWRIVGTLHSYNAHNLYRNFDDLINNCDRYVNIDLRKRLIAGLLSPGVYDVFVKYGLAQRTQVPKAFEFNPSEKWHLKQFKELLPFQGKHGFEKDPEKAYLKGQFDAELNALFQYYKKRKKTVKNPTERIYHSYVREIESGWNWASIAANLKAREAAKPSWDESDAIYYLGSYLDFGPDYPDQHYYQFIKNWHTNIMGEKQACQYRLGQWFDALNDVTEKYGLIYFNGDVDPTDIYIQLRKEEDKFFRPSSGQRYFLGGGE